jgi:hypothetical protein
VLDVAVDDVVADRVGVLGRDNDRVDPGRLPVSVLHRHLAFAVRPQVRNLPCLARLGEATADAMGERDRKRHEFRRFPAGEPDHHSLVARADLVEPVVLMAFARLQGVADADGDLRALLLDRHEHAARLGIEPGVGVGVADAGYGLSDDLRISTYVAVEISPKTRIIPVVVAVSHATRAIGSFVRMASRTASEIWSQTLSGWPSVTDSDVK